MAWSDVTRLDWIRRVPAPPAESDAPRWLAELGRSPLHDQLLLECITTLPPEAARQNLRDLARRARLGELTTTSASVVAWLRGNVETTVGAADLFTDSLRPEREWAFFARLAFDRVLTAALRRGDAVDVARLQDELRDRHPTLPQLVLDAAAARALMPQGALPPSQSPMPPRDIAVAALTDAAGAEPGALATAALARRGSAQLGLAWLAAAARDVPTALRHATESLAFPRSPLAHEDPLHALALRAAMIAAIAEAITGAVDTAPLAVAFARAPVDQERCIANEAWYGEFGPLFGRELLRSAGRSDAWVRGSLAILEAVEASHARHGHGILARATGPETQKSDDERDHERIAAWLFVSIAEAQLFDLGDPTAALALIEPRLVRLGETSDGTNQELLVEASILAARAATYAGSIAEAERFAEAAVRSARSLAAGASREFVLQIALANAPTPPTSRLLGRADRPYSSLLARALVTRANVRATLLGDTTGAAEDLFDAGASWAWDSDRWLHHATDFARRGRVVEARRCLERVEGTVERAYDRACATALLGERDTALALLAEHLAWPGRTAAGRALEITYLARDRDLASLRDDPRFPHR